MKPGQAPGGRGDPGQARTAPRSPGTFRFPSSPPTPLPATFSLFSFLVAPFPFPPQARWGDVVFALTQGQGQGRADTRGECDEWRSYRGRG